MKQGTKKEDHYNAITKKIQLVLFVGMTSSCNFNFKFPFQFTLYQLDVLELT